MVLIDKIVFSRLLVNAVCLLFRLVRLYSKKAPVKKACCTANKKKEKEMTL